MESSGLTEKKEGVRTATTTRERMSPLLFAAPSLQIHIDVEAGFVMKTSDLKNKKKVGFCITSNLLKVFSLVADEDAMDCFSTFMLGVYQLLLLGQDPNVLSAEETR